MSEAASPACSGESKKRRRVDAADVNVDTQADEEEKKRFVDEVKSVLCSQVPLATQSEGREETAKKLILAFKRHCASRTHTPPGRFLPSIRHSCHLSALAGLVV